MGSELRHGRLIRWSAVALWASAVFAASSVPGSKVPGQFGSLAHFVEYAVLAVLVLRALEPDTGTRPAIVLAVVLTSVYGVTDELHQRFVPLRVSDPVDWLADTAGALAGVLCYLAVVHLVRARTGRH